VKIEHTKQKDLVLFYGTIFGVPSFVLLAGLLYSRRARTRGGAAPATPGPAPAPTPEQKGA